MAKTGLGKGLDAFLSDSSIDLSGSNSAQNINILSIDPNSEQPRKVFDETQLSELSESIKLHGVVQPIIVVKKGDRYQIVAGERRWRASMMAGLKEVPAIIRDYDVRQVREISLIENIQRTDLNEIEKAKAMQSLMDEYSLTQNDLAERLGLSRPNIANTLRLLNMPEAIQAMVSDNKISAGHARALAAAKDIETMLALADEVVKKQLSVRQTEKLASMAKKEAKPARKTQAYEIKELEDKLRSIFKTKVTVDGTEQKGKIVISYYSREDIDNIYDILSYMIENNKL